MNCILEHSDEKNLKPEKLRMGGLIEENTKWILEWDACEYYGFESNRLILYESY